MQRKESPWLIRNSGFALAHDQYTRSFVAVFERCACYTVSSFVAPHASCIAHPNGACYTLDSPLLHIDHCEVSQPKGVTNELLVFAICLVALFLVVGLVILNVLNLIGLVVGLIGIL